MLIIIVFFFWYFFVSFAIEEKFLSRLGWFISLFFLVEKRHKCRIKRVKDIYVHDELFSVENKLLTVTIKSKRHELNQLYTNFLALRKWVFLPLQFARLNKFNKYKFTRLKYSFFILIYFIFILKHILIENLSKDFSAFNTHVWLFSNIWTLTVNLCMFNLLLK